MFLQGRISGFGHALDQGPSFGCVLPVFLEYPLDLPRHRFVLDDYADFAAAIHAYRANILTSDKEPVAVNDDTFGVELIAGELADVIVRNYFVIRDIVADYLYAAAGRCLAQQKSDGFLVLHFCIEDA